MPNTTHNPATTPERDIENITGAQQIQNLLTNNPIIAWPESLTVLQLARKGHTPEHISDLTGHPTRHIRKTVAAVGRSLGQQHKNTHAHNHAPLTSKHDPWTKGRGAIRKSYTWILTSEQKHLEHACERTTRNTIEKPTYQHYYDCWLAAHYTWLSLADIVTNPAAAPAYSHAIHHLCAALHHTRTQTRHLLAKTSTTQHNYLTLLRDINWHLDLPDEALNTTNQTAHTALTTAHQRRNLLLPHGLQDISSENLTPLISTNHSAH